MQVPAEVDIAICGAGPVGLALALLLAQRGVPAQRVCVLDAQSQAKSQQDPRSIALSYGSRQILERIHAWPLPAASIEQIHVSRRAHFGRTLIDRNEHQLPAL
ncbi:MAG: FAD-dependent oxidoreductase, partial [Burkholderiales bacterium]|nr:FAD-dependent oxidoreductase [Burkholderiales bacterium]